MKGKLILLLDFDGVIHSYSSGWQGPEIVSDPPVPGTAEFLAQAVKTFDVQIYSARSAFANGIAAMQEWCSKHFSPDVVAELSFPTGKPGAFLTIDDRALTFTGVWPSVETLLSFKPWNKK